MLTLNLLVAAIVSGALAASSPQAGETVSETNGSMAVSLGAYRALQAENEALRRENQTLRKELVARNGALPDTLLPQKVVETVGPTEGSGEDTGYWISAKSKIRHNRRCRNYRKVKGRPCGPTDGKPCKACGG